MRKITFEINAFEQFNYWVNIDKKIFKKILLLLKDTQKNPFTGLGKPEPLKHDLQGYWSKRINEEHRLVYRVEDDSIIIISCRYHYHN
ncbi:Txe/YoeB family addiction module toxin [Geminocystis herdmanii]|uniref:Txe/YoeB family addiction module toxin n=1 Tax=Geminocystis herdmanii TaxID=669359 RepID=UPI0003497D95|nr:Txe/YoeB family addiction module toxin [Geminocystis herdmanii]